MVYETGFENRRVSDGSVGSNPTAPANKLTYLQEVLKMLSQLTENIDFTISNQDVVKLSNDTFTFVDMIRVIQPLLDYNYQQLKTLDETLALLFYSIAKNMKLNKKILSPKERTGLECAFILVHWFDFPLKRVLKIYKDTSSQGLLEEIFVQFTKQCGKKAEQNIPPPTVIRH